MIDAAQITNLRLIHSLAGDVCPACGGGKKNRQTFCGRDYFRLPVSARTGLYARVGHGYREAVIEALTFLEAEAFHE